MSRALLSGAFFLANPCPFSSPNAAGCHPLREFSPCSFLRFALQATLACQRCFAVARVACRAEAVNWGRRASHTIQKRMPSGSDRSGAVAAVAAVDTALKAATPVVPATAAQPSGAEQSLGSGVKLLTLVIPHIDGRLLLGKKLRGFGEGYFNGFGGKVEPGETIEASARRELLEEAHIEADAMEHAGVLHFVFDDKPLPWEVHVFRVTRFRGAPAASDEMEPRWFAPEDVPYQHMWADDMFWYPLFLAGKLFRGTFHFKDTHTLVEHTLEEVQQLHLPPDPL